MAIRSNTARPARGISCCTIFKFCSAGLGFKWTQPLLSSEGDGMLCALPSCIIRIIMRQYCGVYGTTRALPDRLGTPDSDGLHCHTLNAPRFPKFPYSPRVCLRHYGALMLSLQTAVARSLSLMTTRAWRDRSRLLAGRDGVFAILFEQIWG
jgi:hypothetical protein